MEKKLTDMSDGELLVAAALECQRILDGRSALRRLTDMSWEMERRIDWAHPSENLVLLRAACALDYALESSFLTETGKKTQAEREDALAKDVAGRAIGAIQEINRYLEDRAAAGDEEKARMIQNFFAGKLRAAVNDHVRESGMEHRRKSSPPPPGPL